VASPISERSDYPAAASLSGRPPTDRWLITSTAGDADGELGIGMGLAGAGLADSSTTAAAITAEPAATEPPHAAGASVLSPRARPAALRGLRSRSARCCAGPAVRSASRKPRSQADAVPRWPPAAAAYRPPAGRGTGRAGTRTAGTYLASGVLVVSVLAARVLRRRRRRGSHRPCGAAAWRTGAVPPGASAPGRPACRWCPPRGCGPMPPFPRG